MVFAVCLAAACVIVQDRYRGEGIGEAERVRLYDGLRPSVREQEFVFVVPVYEYPVDAWRAVVSKCLVFTVYP